MKVSTIKRVVMRTHGGEGAARKRDMENRLNTLAAVSVHTLKHMGQSVE